MIHKNSYRLVPLALIGILMYSCQNEDERFKEKIPEPTISQVMESDSLPQIKLGEKLENPYSVANMIKSLRKFKGEKSLSNSIFVFFIGSTINRARHSD